MTQYVDGFLLPVPADKIDVYQKLAEKAGEVWLDHGALAYWETVGDDLKSDGTLSFTAAAGVKENELVVLAWVIYPSREERDSILATVMADPRLQCNTDLPFDMTRMAYGGFKPLVNVSKAR
ncbi:MAG: DUF1428 domain-containing protein [Gammaproteobacteria bacterium]|nr:MAG: DUF1428 domain-containing protein [Gammaproteobacteria bacterium]